MLWPSTNSGSTGVLLLDQLAELEDVGLVLRVDLTNVRLPSERPWPR